MKILMVLAHPDDEVIFGWPILQRKGIEKEVLICSSDEHNPNRAWCAKRKHTLFNLCKSLGIPCRCLRYNSAFYKADARKGELKQIRQTISEEIRKTEFDFVFTHNPLGEYGMLDHILVHNIVMSTVNKGILISDILLENIWTPTKTISESYKRVYYTRKFSSNALDMTFYNKCKEFYTKDRVWTWNKPPVVACSVYQV